MATDWSQLAINIFNNPAFAQARKDCVLIRTTYEMNVDTGYNEATTQNFKFKAVFLQPTLNLAQTDEPITSAQLTGDAICMFPIKGTRFKPTLEDKLLRGTTTYKIIDIVIDPTEGAYYKLTVRKG